MKIFLITWGLLCFLVIVGLFIAYATDTFPMQPQKQLAIDSPEAEENCSPCEENLKRLKKAMERAEEERLSRAAIRSESDEAASSTR